MTKFRMLKTILTLAGAGYAPLSAMPASAASFDCTKAARPEEKAICADRVLSELDTEMGALWFAFSRVPMAMGSNGARRDDAEQFLAARAKCGANVACLRPLYRARITTLKSNITDAMNAISREENN